MAELNLRYDFATNESMARVWQRVATSIEADEHRAEFRLLSDDELEFVAAAGDNAELQQIINEALRQE